MLDEFLVLVFWFAMLVPRTDTASCPHRFHGNGITPAGRFTCLADLVGDGDDSLPWTDAVLVGRIRCTAGVPVVVNERRFGCRMRKQEDKLASIVR